MTYTMEQPSLSSRRIDEPDFNLRVWALKAQMSRDITKSRRHSASNVKSCREEARSFRSTTTISSTVSSPGYTLREEIINPYSYSFTTALRALQARAGYSCECVSPDGFALSLNSKWNEAEKYICNPLSGEVPMECLSAKTLSGRSGMTVSGPLVYSSQIPFVKTKPNMTKQDTGIYFSSFQGKKIDTMQRDMGTQSTPTEISSSSPSPSSTPPNDERALKRCETESEGSTFSGTKSKYDEEIEMATKEEGEEQEEEPTIMEEKLSKQSDGARCLPWKKSLWMRRKHKEHQNCGWQVLFWKRNVVKLRK